LCLAVGLAGLASECCNTLRLAELERRRASGTGSQVRQIGTCVGGRCTRSAASEGKLNCACAAPDHLGHGPQWNLTRAVGGRTRAVHLRPGPELDKARREVAEYERFRDLVGQVTEVNEAICAAHPVVPVGDAHASLTGREEGKVGSETRSRWRRPRARTARHESTRTLVCREAGTEAAEQVIPAGLLRLGGIMLAKVMSACRGTGDEELARLRSRALVGGAACCLRCTYST
jgi:hypothetical protein